jgi:2-polyprenyl-3-methyl-5-hydroxy-6-metoxy-1,4-benzoquinol methylase
MTPSPPIAQNLVACSIPCDLCGSRDVEQVCSFDRYGQDLRTVVCRRCGLVWTDPRPSATAVRDYYVHHYRLELRGTRQPRSHLVYRAANGAIARYRKLQPILKPGARVLDLGAGSGEFVYVLRAAGYDASGIEPDGGYAHFASQALNVPVTHGFYQDVHVPEASQDVVTMFHVAEHLESPFDAITRARQWLAPGGRLLIEVPNVEALCQWPRGRYQKGHLHNFNGPVLEMLGRKAGFTLVSSVVSPDGGNLEVILEKSEADSNLSGEIPGNFERVQTILRRHTAWRHMFSRHPYVRPIKRLAARIDEYWHARKGSPKELLDARLPTT